MMDEWKSISTKIPPEDEDFLLWDGNRLAIGERLYTDEQGRINFLVGSTCFNPTHWKELPDPPKVEIEICNDENLL